LGQIIEIRKGLLETTTKVEARREKEKKEESHYWRLLRQNHERKYKP